MTRYDDVEMDPRTGLSSHPLAGVPQEALDAATKALEAASREGAVLVLDSDDLEPVAHAVLQSALEEMKP